MLVRESGWKSPIGAKGKAPVCVTSTPEDGVRLFCKLYTYYNDVISKKVNSSLFVNLAFYMVCENQNDRIEKIRKWTFLAHSVVGGFMKYFGAHNPREGGFVQTKLTLPGSATVSCQFPVFHNKGQFSILVDALFYTFSTASIPLFAYVVRMEEQ